MADKGVLLIDWDNLAGAVLGRGKVVDRILVDRLWEFARDRTDSSVTSHMAATRFDPSISRAMQEHLIEPHVVRAAKEQADILLTVLAMDYLHAKVQNFIVVTGDQDFIPLIERLHRNDAQVTVVYGDSRKLSAELTKTLATVGVESLDIDRIADLQERRADSSGRAFAAMLELTRRGYILGGKGRDDRLQLLVDWGLASSGEENDYWALVDQFCRKETRFGAAVRKDQNWIPVNQMRTYLDVTDTRMEEVTALDSVLRVLSSRPVGVTIGALATGPLSGDDGKKVDRTLDALVALGLVRRTADGGASIVGAPLPLGYLEPLWRVHAALLMATHRQGVTSIAFPRLESLLGAGGIGQGGKDSRAAGLVKDTVRHALAAGVIDVVAVGGKRHARIVDSKLTDPIERAYRVLFAEYRERIGEKIPEDEVLEHMKSLDESQNRPAFGYHDRDRHRVIRVLSQSGLILRRDKVLTFVDSAWGSTLAGAAR